MKDEDFKKISTLLTSKDKIEIKNKTGLSIHSIYKIINGNRRNLKVSKLVLNLADKNLKELKLIINKIKKELL